MKKKTKHKRGESVKQKAARERNWMLMRLAGAKVTLKDAYWLAGERELSDAGMEICDRYIKKIKEVR